MGIKPPYYCGPQGWPKWLRKWLSQKFNACCKQHDEDYKNPTKARALSDHEFKECCLCAAVRDRAWRAVAKVYFAAVDAFGWLAKWPRWLQK